MYHVYLPSDFYNVHESCIGTFSERQERGIHRN